MAGENSYTLRRSLSGAGLTVGGIDITAPSPAFIPLRETIEAGTVNRPFAVSVLTAKMLAIAFSASVDMTVKTNSTSAPDETIALTAGKERIWETTADGSTGKLITHDLTVIYVSNAGANAGLFQCLIAYNPN